MFDAGWNDGLAFLRGTTTGVGAATCNSLVAAAYSTDASDLNVASIAIGAMPGVQTVRRKVTNVSGGVSIDNASVSGMAGFTLARGETRELAISFTRTTAAANAYTGGPMRLADGTHTVRIPGVVRPVQPRAPAAVASNGAPISVTVGFGYNGVFTAGPCRLAPAIATPGSDIDLCVFQGNTLVGSSGSGTSAEEANLLNAVELSTYKVVVHGWGVQRSSPTTTSASAGRPWPRWAEPAPSARASAASPRARSTWGG